MKKRMNKIKDSPMVRLFSRRKIRKIRHSKHDDAKKEVTIKHEIDEHSAPGAEASSYYNMSAWYDLLNSPPLYHSL